MTLAAGTRLGPYTITAPIGAGGMGEVYRAHDERLEREVAVKVLPENVASDAARLERFQQEARSASALNHPGILTVHDFGRHEGIVYLVTELLEGETLRQRLSRGKMPEREAFSTAAQIARALSAAHAKGIVHRDLKPENLFVTPDGRVKILDFGLARRTPLPDAASAGSQAATVEHLTQAGAVVGTLGYMAPEQARGLPVDARADLFSLGCVVFEMLEGRRAFEKKSAADTISAILNEDPLGREAAPGAIAEDAERVLRHCLEKEPSRRFQTAGDAAFAFESLISSSHPGGSGDRAAAIPRGGRRWLIPSLIAAVIVAAITAGVALRGRRPAAAASAASVKSIAVLPFTNVAGDPGLDYLGDGVAETLISRLSPIEGLEVLARTTVFRFKGNDVDPLKVGRELKVNAVLAGRVEEVKGRLLIGAELVDVASGAQLWGERFNRPSSDLFEIEEDVARRIAESLAVRLGKAERERLGAKPTENEEAYRLYLQGRHLWYQRTIESVRKSIELFRTAVELDPGFAMAWNGLGDAYTVGWAGYGTLPIAEAYERGEAAVRRALELNDNLPEAHTSLAFLLFERQWDWAGTEREFRRALELDSGSAYTHQAYGEYLYCVGRFDESLAELQRAHELDPLSEIVSSVTGWSYLASRDFDRAIEQFRSVLAREPGFIDSQSGLTLATVAANRPEPERARNLIDLVRASGRGPDVVASMQETYGRGGMRALWQALLDLQTGNDLSGWLSSPQFQLWIYGRMGEIDKAMEIFERMYAERSPAMSYAKTGVFYDPLRNEPRFQEIMAELNFPDAPAAP